MKVDIFNHIFPRAYFDRMIEVAGKHKDIGKRVREIPVLVDLDLRLKQMEEFGDDYRQIPCLGAPPLEALGGPEVATDLARIANDGMAEIVSRHPGRFPSFVASLPMNAPEAAVEEAKRAVNSLGACGVQIFTNVNGKPLDLPEFRPLFDTMAALDKPLWLHPARTAAFADYQTEDRSEYEIWWTFGWPYETSVTMARLVFSGLFDRHPGLKIITHHCGAMVPYFEGRVGPGQDQLGSRTSDRDLTQVLKSLKKRPLDYFKMFLADTATFSSGSALRCGLDFFGVDNILFASDSPFDPEKGPGYIRDTIRVIDALDIPAADRAKIYSGNIARLCGLTF